jgi:putative transposase
MSVYFATMIYGELYFYTSSIRHHHPLIRQYDFYRVITDSLSFLHHRKCLRIYGFVIMPNHMHLIWQLLKKNGKESPVASFMKHTAHQFEQHIRANNPDDLVHYCVTWHSRQYNFWQPEPDWFLLLKEHTTRQKLDYIHNNPLQTRWNLVSEPAAYRYSSARFYETGKSEFDFLFDYRDFDDRLG